MLFVDVSGTNTTLFTMAVAAVQPAANTHSPSRRTSSSSVMFFTSSHAISPGVTSRSWREANCETPDALLVSMHPTMVKLCESPVAVNAPVICWPNPLDVRSRRTSVPSTLM